MEQELTIIQKAVHDVLPKGQKNKITVKRISKILGISTRHVVRTLAELREFYPVCSTTLDGGGVWIADCNKDVVNFVKKMQRLRDQHQQTINFMEGHIK